MIFSTFCHLMQLMLCVLSLTPVPVGNALGMKHSCCQGEPLNAFLPFCVADDKGMVKQMFFWFLLENCRLLMANFLLHAYH